MNITVYPRSMQGVGNFNDGQIIEYKPIAFPRETTAIPRLGPLFYWAWAETKITSKIPLHPHRAFEILSYGLKGKVEHYDTAGHQTFMQEGDAQLIKAGSGISHSETLFAPHTEMFQIWFEPNLSETITHHPFYAQYNNEDFPVKQEDESTIKTIIGEHSSIELETDVQMYDITTTNSFDYAYKENRQLAIMVMEGNGAINGNDVRATDFVVITELNKKIHFTTNDALRIVVIDVPIETDYPLYHKVYETNP